MKVATLVYGMYREFDIASKSWSFIKNLDSDIYFSTWSHSKQYNKRLDILIDETVREEQILTKFPHANVSILEDKDVELTNTQKMVFHWKNCLSMLEDSGKEYDYLILTRPDNYVIFNHNKNDLKHKSSNDRIYGLEEIKRDGEELFIQDIFFMGTYECISKLIRNLPTKNDVNGFDGYIHHNLSKQILLNDMFVEKIDGLSVVTVRANARELKENEININNIFKKTMEWGENQSQYYENNF
jgi:hypothetical protein